MSKTITLGAAVAATFAFNAQADHILEIDLTVPNQITINSTSGVSLATVTGSDGIGAYFENFYNGDGASGLNETLVSGDITNVGNPSDSSPNLFRSGTTDPGLNLFSWSPDSDVTFTAGTQAFTGSGTWTLEADDYADMLAGNISGNVYFPADDDGDLANATVIGTYLVVIPAPASAALLGLGGLAAARRRR